MSSTAALFDNITQKTEEEYHEDYTSGTDGLNNLKKDFVDYRKQMYDCINNLIEEKDRDSSSMNHSRDELFNRIIPQLKFIDELTAVVHSYPHRALPTTTEFLNALVENTKLAIDNVQNVGMAGPVYMSKGNVVPHPGLMNKQATVPYAVLHGGSDDSDSDSNKVVHDASDSDSDKEKEIKPANKSKKQSRKSTDIVSNSSDSDDLEFIEKKNPAGDESDNKSDSSSEPKKSAPRSTTRSTRGSRHESSSSSSSKSSSVDTQHGGAKKKKKVKRRVRRSTKLNNQANTRTL
jgi:hypothetical protein